ncbi:hypothetical protein ACW9HR_36905 [Nocardia gipuzkoensis]
MLVLYVGDPHFSGWSMRGRVAVAEKCVPVTERVVELDWPTSKNADGKLMVGDVIDEREARFGCHCDPATLQQLDAERLLSKTLATLLPRVPILVDTDTKAVATDVVSIAGYLDDIAPMSGSRLMGTGPRERARILSVCGWATHDLIHLIEDAPYAKSLRPYPGVAPARAVEQARWVCDVVADLLRQFGGPFAVGEFSLADVMLSTCLQQIAGWEIPIDDADVAAYSRRVLTRASVAAHLEQARAPYRAIDNAETGSPTWIVRHYRFHAETGLLHDWQRDRCKRLGNATAVQAVKLAYSGLGIEAITSELARTYAVSPARVRADVEALFTHLTPTA